MLNEYQRALICDALDRALTDEQRTELRVLLADLPEARALYMKLRADRRRMRRLPRQLAPASLVNDVMQQIAQHRIIELPKPVRPNQRVGAWLSVAAALVVIVGLALVSRELMSYRSVDSRGSSVAKVRPHHEPEPTTTPENRALPPEIKSTQEEPSAPVVKLEPESKSLENLPVIPDSLPVPQLSEGEAAEALAAPYNNLLRLSKVEMPKLPPILTAADLHGATARTQLMDAIRGQLAVHIDLFCPDTNPVLGLLTRAFEEQRRVVVIDGVARLRYQAKRKTDYLLVTEWNSSEQIGDFISSLGARANQAGRPLLNYVVPMPMSSADVRTLANLLGVDAKSLVAQPAQVDPKQSLSNSTIQELARALDRNGGRGKVGSHVLTISVNPVRPNPAQSKEIREFLAARGEPAPGSILSVLRVRHSN